MTHPLYQLRSQDFADVLYHFCPGNAILGIYPDFDELMMVKGKIYFIQYWLGQPATPDDNHRFSGVNKAFKVTFLNVV